MYKEVRLSYRIHPIDKECLFLTAVRLNKVLTFELKTGLGKRRAGFKWEYAVGHNFKDCRAHYIAQENAQA